MEQESSSQRAADDEINMVSASIEKLQDYNVNAADMGEQSLVQKVSERLEDAYNNIPSVKAAREKREAALVPIKIDPKFRLVYKNHNKSFFIFI